MDCEICANGNKLFPSLQWERPYNALCCYHQVSTYNLTQHWSQNLGTRTIKPGTAGTARHNAVTHFTERQSSFKSMQFKITHKINLHLCGVQEQCENTCLQLGQCEVCYLQNTIGFADVISRL